MTEKFTAINWNKIENKVDYSAWSRLNDFIWEPERIPVNEDKEEFDKLPENIQETILKAFAVLGFLSTIQVKVGDDAVKQDAATPQEISVFNAFSYLESIANKSYSNVIQKLANPLKINTYFDWANETEELQLLANKYCDIYQNGTANQRKIALSFMEMSIYHSAFYAPLYLFGEGKLERTAESVKLAMRSTTFNAMYPGVKFRLANGDTSNNKALQAWLDDFVEDIQKIMFPFIAKFYDDVGWTKDATNYYRYTVNKNFMNLGFNPPYPDDEDSYKLSQRIQKGVIDNAHFEDFFYYADKNNLTHIDKMN